MLFRFGREQFHTLHRISSRACEAGPSAPHRAARQGPPPALGRSHGRRQCRAQHASPTAPLADPFPATTPPAARPRLPSIVRKHHGFDVRSGRSWSAQLRTGERRRAYPDPTEPQPLRETGLVGFRRPPPGCMFRAKGARRGLSDRPLAGGAAARYRSRDSPSRYRTPATRPSPIRSTAYRRGYRALRYRRTPG